MSRHSKLNPSLIIALLLVLGSKSAEGQDQKYWNNYPVPPKYQRFIRNPITSQIKFVVRKRIVNNWGSEDENSHQWLEKAALIPVRINVGRVHGVQRNMLFRLVGEPRYAQYLQIMNVARTISRGYVVRDISGDGKETYYDFDTSETKLLPPIRVGIKVTTSPLID